jgi:hypothetical protein
MGFSEAIDICHEVVLDSLVIFPEFMEMDTRHDIKLSFQVLDSQGVLQCDMGSLGCLPTKTIFLGERVNMKSVVFIDERWIFERNTAPNVYQDVTHLILLSH